MDTTETLHTLGQIARAVWPAGDLPVDVMAQMLTHPLRGIALAQRKAAWHEADQEEIARLMDRLPADLDDDPDGIPEVDQYPFWHGYYSYANMLDRCASTMYGGLTLTAVGNAIWGEHWQTPMAKTLKLSGTARIRDWISGYREIPAGVWLELDALLRGRKSRLDAINDALPDPGSAEHNALWEQAHKIKLGG